MPEQILCCHHTCCTTQPQIDRLEHDRNEQARVIHKLQKSVHRLGGIVEKLRTKLAKPQCLVQRDADGALHLIHTPQPHVITAQSCGPDCPACMANRAAGREEDRQHFLPLRDFDKAAALLRGAVNGCHPWRCAMMREALCLLEGDKP